MVWLERRCHNQVSVVARRDLRRRAEYCPDAGAVVDCTGRSVRGHPATAGRPETIEETAEMVIAAGGYSVAVRTDHTVEAEVERLFACVWA